ncbi:hypothetical protein FQR65_LT08275 [Abscondita terminalis]|nr:hypothetical protein FQR65_LT08275 [Abscondita terminalis]
MAHQLRKVCKYFTTSTNQENGIVTCLLKHPKLNVITLEFIQKLQDFLSDLECHKPNGLIFVSEFDKKWFSAGFDLKDLYQPCEGRLTQLFGSMLDFSVQIRSTSFPTVTIINGDALGGGCIIPFGCEHRIMLKDTNIGLTELNFGFGVLEWQWLWLTEIIGQRAAEDAVLRAKLFSSEEAIRVGLVHEIVSSKEEGVDRAVEFINEIAKINSRGRTVTKLSLKSNYLKKIHENRTHYITELINQARSSDVQNSLNKFFKVKSKDNTNF